jgi:hypothetical protein
MDDVSDDGCRHRRGLLPLPAAQGDFEMATTTEEKTGITPEQQQELDEVFERARKVLAIGQIPIGNAVAACDIVRRARGGEFL